MELTNNCTSFLFELHTTIEDLAFFKEDTILEILLSGLEPFISPEPLPPIEKEDIKLINWIAIASTD